jgi:hypothetical protein
MEPLFIIAFVVVVGIGVRLLAGNLDKTRIEQYLNGQGAMLSTCAWSPFSRGWFGTKNERLYEITYTDAEGNGHYAVCKTSLLSGVYFTEDSITAPSSSRDATGQGVDEVTRLRNEVADLKRKLGQ